METATVDRVNISGNWPVGPCVHVRVAKGHRLKFGIVVIVKLDTLFDVSTAIA
jgi:hypothetical protein